MLESLHISARAYLGRDELKLRHSSLLHLSFVSSSSTLTFFLYFLVFLTS